MKPLSCLSATFAFLLFALAVLGQTGASYDTLIQQGKAQLQARSSTAALATGQQAIQLDANRWEAYALAGGALMNLKRYEEAEDQLSHAIDHAPAAKQEGLRSLRKQCFQAESGVTPANAGPAQPAATTQAEIVLWKTIENSSNSDDFNAYLKQYPRGAFAVLAQQHLDELKANAAQERQAVEAKAEQERHETLDRLTWTDSSTGLMWAKLDISDPESNRQKNFSEAEVYCSGSHLLQLTDWRLPTADELEPISSTPSDFLENTTQVKKLIAPPLWTSSEGPKTGEHLMVMGGKHFTVKDKEKGLAHYLGAIRQWLAGDAICVRDIKATPAAAEQSGK